MAQGGTVIMNIQHSVLGLAAVAVLSGCAHQAQRAGANSTVQFGVVRSAEQVTLEANAPAGAIVGGTLGLMMSGSGTSSSRRARNAILGAGAGAVTADVAQGDRRGMAYQVDMIDGSVVRIVTDQREIKTGDCVAIERARETANIRRVSQAYCDRANSRAVESVAEHSMSEATACEAAKQELVEATSPEAVELAARKVSLLCDS
jgi:outer membrane lipoprotein SlyB